MAVTSPTSASPGLSLLDWDEAAVHSYLRDLGLAQYEELIYEHGITGDVLSVMDHSALQDLGMESLGHRISVLRAIWELKKEQGIDIAEDDWRPKDEVVEMQTPQPMPVVNVDRLWDMLMEQHERLMNLERDHSRLLAALEDNGIHVPVPSSPEGELRGIPGIEVNHENGEGGLRRQTSMRWRDFSGKSSDGEEGGEATNSKATRRASALFPSSLASSTVSSNPPLTSDSTSSTFQDSFTPTTTSASYPFDSPSNTGHPVPVHSTKPQPPPFTRLISGSSILPSNPSPPPGSTPPPPSLPSSGSSKASQPAAPSAQAKSSAKDAAHSAAKSFRVTLEDPCWKVLPAALKKYKINDDWKMYALFICFGNTERCLSYDEKPLMLFQQLKERGNKPVFMLRHIKDIKSPIAVAQQKQAVKLGLPPNSAVNVLPSLKPSTSTSSPTGTKFSTDTRLHRPPVLHPVSAQGLRAGDDGLTPNGGNFPELPSPGLQDAQRSGSTGTLVDKDGNVQKVTYAISIYPYIADRQDEFDVAVGATFVVLSKAKGWWIVQKDPDGMGNIVPDQTKSGWVPAGCLLELSSPISAVSPTTPEMTSLIPGRQPLPPAAIMSSSYPGIVLMDYEAKGDDELTLKEGDKIRVYKKYCHWSYSIQQETGERGWVPAWFIGKLASSPGGTDSQPGSAATAADVEDGVGRRKEEDGGGGVEGDKVV
ncbi:protein STE50, partial [Tremellales sp. Uapishka_1]